MMTNRWLEYHFQKQSAIHEGSGFEILYIWEINYKNKYNEEK